MKRAICIFLMFICANKMVVKINLDYGIAF
jgi:hypothetical protein